MEAQRPAVSVVMPFAGERSATEAALRSLRSLEVGSGDELILVDNSTAGAASHLTGGETDPPIRVLVAGRERSPAHARNVGATQARSDWILFLDADTVPRPGLLEAFFRPGLGEGVGAVAGDVVPAAGARTLASRYGAARSFLGQRSHYEHSYRPRAAAANLLVRRAAFVQLGGFYEGVRAGEDTDFTWRLQEAGWRLEFRPAAAVEHRYRATLGELRRQWRGYAAGRAWLGRRYEGFRPEPAVKRALDRGRDGALHRLVRRNASGSSGGREHATGDTSGGRLEHARFLALDMVLGLEELAGFALSNRPARGDGRVGARRGGRRRRHSARTGSDDQVDVVLVAERFPVRDDPLVELAGTLERVRVEAVARPRAGEGAPAGVPVSYLEDDGAASRWAAASLLVVRRPVRSAADVLKRPSEAPPLRVLAPAVRRLARERGARVHPLSASGDDATAERLARLSGRSHPR